jgi:methanogenic corrinoid protein MtbC1
MSQELLVERFFETLINGDRRAAREVLDETFAQNVPAETVLTGLMWPTHEMIEKLYRSDQLTKIGYHFSTRLLRSLIDQTAGRLSHMTQRGKSVLAFCGTAEGEELGAQIAVDLLESKGYTTRFAGGGVPADEILAQVHEHRPDILLMFCSAASDLPGVRQIIDTLREIGACPKTQVVVGGGVFNRAEGLAEEIGAAFCACNPLEVVEVMAMSGETFQRTRAAAPAPVRRQVRRVKAA